MLGKRLREIRESQALTQEAVEAETRISQPYLSQIERDRKVPTSEMCMLIAEVLGVTDEVLAELHFERDRAEIQKLGYDPEIARLAAALERLDEEDRAAILDRALHEVSALFPAAKESAEPTSTASAHG